MSAKEPAVHRAGGHIDREDGKGWVVDDTPPEPPPEERPRKQLVTQGPDSGGWVLTPEPDPVAADVEPSPPRKRAAKKATAKSRKEH